MKKPDPSDQESWDYGTKERIRNPRYKAFAVSDRERQRRRRNASPKRRQRRQRT